MNRLISLKSISKKLPKSSNSHYFCRTFHSVSRIRTHKPSNCNSHFLSPLHQWRSSSSSSSSSNSGLKLLLSKCAFPKHPVSSAQFKSSTKTFLGSGIRFLSTDSSEIRTSSLRVSLRRFQARYASGLEKLSNRKAYTVNEVLYLLIFVNASVFIMWQVLPQDFMYKHFTYTPNNNYTGQLYRIFTSAFSHSGVIHFVSNMLGLYVFGTSIGTALGWRGPSILMYAYVLGALGGSIVYWSQYEKKREISSNKDPILNKENIQMDPLLGPNAAVHSLVLLEIFNFTRKRTLPLVSVPLKYMLLGSLIIGKDLLRTSQGDDGGYAHLVGGALTAAYLFYRRGI